MSPPSRLPRWGLRRRIAVALALIGVVLLAEVAVSGTLLIQLRQSQNRVAEDYFTAITLSNQQFVGLLDAQAAVRGYALTGRLSAAETEEGIRLFEMVRAD